MKGETMVRLAIAGILLLCALPLSAATLPCSGTQQVPATYAAAGGEQLQACFDLVRKNVTVGLADGSRVVLPVAVSGSGARYSDGTRTFWEHQGIGRYFVGEKLLFEGGPAPATGYKGGVTSKLLKQTTLTANGQKIAYPVTDRAEVTAMTVDLAPGAETGWHKHTIPVYAYVLTGVIEVELEGGQRVSYKAGDAIIEVVDAFHNGSNRGTETVRLVVFYTGIKNQPNVVRR